MTRRRQPRRSAPARNRTPPWAWIVGGLALLAVAALAWPLLEARRTAALRESLPAVDLAPIESRVASAINEAQRAVEDDPRSAERWGALGATFDAHGLYDQAEACYAIAHRLDDRDFRWAYFLAIVRDVNGADAEEVERLFDDATRIRDDYAAAWFRMGHALSLRGRQARARNAFERAIALEPDLAPAHRELGQVLLALDDDPAALAALRRAAELNPSDAGVWSALAQALSRAGRPDDARAAADRVRHTAPATALRDPVHGRFVAARGCSTVQLLERAGAQLAAGDSTSALRTLGPVLADTPDDAQARYLAGTAHARAGSAAAAREQFDRALTIDPVHVGALLESGALLEAENRTREARDLYLRAQAAAPLDPHALASLARASAMSGDDASASRAFEQLAEVQNLAPRTLMNWGNALTRLGRMDDAIERYRAALQLQPDYAHVHFNMAWALEESGLHSDAIRHYREAQRLDASLPTASALRRLGAGR